MKKNNSQSILVIIVLLCLIGCKGCAPDLATEVKLLAGDHKISKAEFKALSQKLKDSNQAKFKSFENPQNLYKQILRTLEAQDIVAEVWNPKPSSGNSAFNVNVFLENSESINGYVNGASDFKNSIYNMLVNVKMIGQCKSLNLNYINTKIPFTKENALNKDIQAFIKNLSPATFKIKGGGQTTSDLAAVIDVAISKVNSNNLSVLISDFVFSPGSGEIANNYLENQSTSIRSSVSDKLKHENIAIAILHMTSSFDGSYFTLYDRELEFKGNRPYYIWLIGRENQVKSLLENQVIKDSDKSFMNKVVFKSTKSLEDISYKVTRHNLIGDYISGANKGELKNVKSVNGKFSFSIAVNFAANLRGGDYFVDPTNYLLSENYSLTTRLLTEKEKASPALFGYTHLLTLKTETFDGQSFDISVRDKLPAWVQTTTSLNDTNILNDKAEHRKTFGLKYLINGVSDAFKPNPIQRENIISKIRITIKQ